LTALGWVDQQNIQITFRWTGDDVERVRTYAADLTGEIHRQSMISFPFQLTRSGRGLK